MNVDEAARRVRAAIGHRVAGYCYVSSEAVYHLAGGKRAGLVPVVISLRDVGSHWFLRDKRGRIIDVTAGQFRPRLTRDEYADGRGCGFMTRRPSGGAQAIIDFVRSPVGRRITSAAIREWKPEKQSPAWFREAGRSRALKVALKARRER